MSRKSSFWNSFKRETGKNTGKWLSNKIFGNGWSTPTRHEISMTQNKEVDDHEEEIHDDNDEDYSMSDIDITNNLNIKNVETNAHDIEIERLRSKISQATTRAYFRQEEKKSKRGWIIGVGLGIIFIVGTYLLNDHQKTKKINDAELQLSLERKEIKILQLLEKGQKDDALEIVMELNHPSEDQMPGSGKITEIFNQTRYKNYWDEKREALKKRIFSE